MSKVVIVTRDFERESIGDEVDQALGCEIGPVVTSLGRIYSRKLGSADAEAVAQTRKIVGKLLKSKHNVDMVERIARLTV